MFDTQPRAPEGRLAVQLRWPTPRCQADGRRPPGRMTAAASLDLLRHAESMFSRLAARGRAASPTTRGHRTLVLNDFQSS